MGEAVGSCGGLLRRRRSLKVLSTTLGRFRGRARARARFRGGDRGVGQPVAVADRPGGVGREGPRSGEGGGRRRGCGGGCAVGGAWGGSSTAAGVGSTMEWAGRRARGGELDGSARGGRSTTAARGDRMEKWPQPASGLDISRPVCRVSARYDTRQHFLKKNPISLPSVGRWRTR